MLSQILQFFSRGQIGIHLNGMYHNKRTYFTLECSGFLYFVLFLYLFFADVEILLPLWNNDINHVETNYKP